MAPVSEFIKENLMRGLFTEPETGCGTWIKVCSTPKAAQQRTMSVLKKQGREWLWRGLWFSRENYPKEMRSPIKVHNPAIRELWESCPTSLSSCLQSISLHFAVTRQISETRR